MILNRLLPLLLPLALTTATACVPAQAGEAHAMRNGYIYLGERFVNGGYDHDVIHVGRADGRFTSMMIVVENAPADFCEFPVCFPSDHVIRELADRLELCFVAHFGSAEDHRHFRCDFLEDLNQFDTQLCVPNVHAQADDLRITRQESLSDIGHPLVDVELDDAGARLKIAEVRQQIAQAERSMDILRVQS